MKITNFEETNQFIGKAYRKGWKLNLPVVVGQISPDKAMRLPFNQMIMELPRKVDKVSVVSAENTSTTDSTHFDAASQRLLGERYARAMQKLLSN